MKTKNTLAIALALALAMILVPAASIIADDNSAGDSELYNSGVVLGVGPVDHVVDRRCRNANHNHQILC